MADTKAELIEQISKYPKQDELVPEPVNPD